ncbi:potassium-transporting ATPase subunit F [Chamaesiphon sp. GL140_3_metabinner_50]|uniref:potassium-transporting ATPase subunit F n=1 Tax=Chamaesiphon sp. GL140_3_metabinner_50 TaxID=2970812 RepID=UPI0025E5D08A|nr:potassium-transporting ATPase subunit F [Chamaesiphon sp. GL140_3_metabinner_50]
MNSKLSEDFTFIWSAWNRRKYPTYLFLALCLNVVLASAAFAATGDAFSRPQIYALGILGLGTIALSAYLFVVMFQPERF